MPSIGRGVAIASVTAGLMLAFSTLFDALWWTADRLAVFDNPVAQGAITMDQGTAEDQTLKRNGSAAPKNHHPARLTLEHCDAANLHQGAAPGVKAHVDRVIDGDTIDVFVAGQKQRIRLWGIDAPEKDQPLGQASKTHLERIVRPGSTIEVHPVDLDSYNRTVAVTGYPSDTATNFQMLYSGMAYHSQWPDAQANRCLRQAARLAADLRTGVWAEAPTGGIRPWDHRNSP